MCERLASRANPSAWMPPARSKSGLASRITRKSGSLSPMPNPKPKTHKSKASRPPKTSGPNGAMSGYHVPDAAGHFGPYGGRFVPETLMSAIEDLTREYLAARDDRFFQRQFADYLQKYAGRPTPPYHAAHPAQKTKGAPSYPKRA